MTNGTSADATADETLEQRAFDDIDTMGSEARHALTALRNGESEQAEEHLGNIKDTAEAWGDGE